MIPVTSDSKEITDTDVENVVRSALTKSMTPDREVITFIPEEFVVDGFQGIRDPRGMMGIRLEMRGLLYTGPRTILHNLCKTVERAGVQLENVIISPLAMTKSILNEVRVNCIWARSNSFVSRYGRRTSCSIIDDSSW